MFQWTIESIPQSNTGTGVLYKGTPLDHCDLTSLYIHGDSRSYAIDYTGVVTCKAAEGYELRAKTAFTLSNLPGKYSPFYGGVGSTNLRVSGAFDPRTDDPRGFAFGAL